MTTENNGKTIRKKGALPRTESLKTITELRGADEAKELMNEPTHKHSDEP